MECSDIREELSAYMDNELSDGERQRVDEHLRTCSACALELDDLKKTLAQVQELEEVQPPAWLSQRVMARVREEAGERKKVIRNMYFPVQIKVPVSIFAMLAVAVTAYFLFRTIDPEMRTALPRSQEQTALTEKSDVLAGKPAVEKERETPVAALEERMRRDASDLKTNRMTQHTGRSAAGPADKLLTRTVLVHDGNIHILLETMEMAVKDLGGEVTGTEAFEDTDILFVTIGSDKLKELDDKLTEFGDLTGPVDAEELQGMVEMKIEIMRGPSLQR